MSSRSIDNEQFVLHRVIVFMIGGAFLFVGAAAIGFLGWAMEALEAPAVVVLAARSEIWARIFENQQRISIVMRLGYFAEAFLGLAAIAGAVLLMKRVAWAPLFLELVTWSVPAVYLIMVMTADPWMHHHVTLYPHSQRDAIVPYEAFHRLAAVWLVVASVIAGALLMFLQRRRLEQDQSGRPR